jgi:predicted transposase/invertase (TIGR01784 family)
MIRKAVNTLYELSADERVRVEYEARQKAWRDRLSQNEGYYLDGIQQGKLEGKLEEKLETARRMKTMSLSADQIKAATGLSPQDIAKL